jgi:hypothetical protein
MISSIKKEIMISEKKTTETKGFSLPADRMHLHKGLLPFVATSFEMPKSLHQEDGRQL